MYKFIGLLVLTVIGAVTTKNKNFRLSFILLGVVATGLLVADFFIKDYDSIKMGAFLVLIMILFVLAALERRQIIK